MSRERTAHVCLISKTISPGCTVRVRSHLNREDEQLLPGTFARAVSGTNRVAVPTLPEKARVQCGA